MRRLLALVLVAVPLLGGTATADPDCTYAGHNGTRVGLCTEYVCEDICAPELHVDPQCSEDLNPPSALVRAVCGGIDALYVVVP